LFNTGTVSWFYRCLVEGLFGLKGDRHGLVVHPQLPDRWSRARVRREFRGATFAVEMRRDSGVSNLTVTVDGQTLPGNRIEDIQQGRAYKVDVSIPGNLP
jgi:cellobionic acid phosphorylase